MIKRSKESKLTRFQYYGALRTYCRQIDYREISSMYYNVGTIFNERLYILARQSLLNYLAESTGSLREKLSERVDVTSSFEKNFLKNISLLCDRRESLMDKLHHCKRIEKKDVVFTFFGLPERLFSYLKK